MKKVLTLVTACAGVALTYYLNHALGLGSVLASAVVGLIGGLVLKDYEGVNFTASFMGMSSASVLVSPVFALLSGVVLFYYWPYFKNRLKGLGGKYGTIALLSVVTFSIILLIFTPGYEFDLVKISAYSSINSSIVLTCLLSGVLSLVLMHFLREHVSSDCVVTSSIIGVISGLIVFLPGVDYLIPLVAYSGSFAGMCSKKLLTDYKNAVFIGGLVGLVYLTLYGFFPGYGGKLGFIGLLSILVYERSSNLFSSV